MTKVTVLLLTVQLMVLFGSAQPQDKFEKNLKTHILYLSSDLLEGRDTGSKGANLAADYIEEKFWKIGLKPKGVFGSSTQQFTFTSSREPSMATLMSLNKLKLGLGKDFYPLSYSKNGFAKGKVIDVNYGIASGELGYDDFKNIEKFKKRIALVKMGNPDQDNPHSEYAKYADMRTKLENLERRGIRGAIFYYPNDDEIKTKINTKIKPGPIPAVVIGKKEVDALLSSSKRKASLNIAIKNVEKTGKNVLGYIDNGSANTVVIGAHYDHIGYGQHGNSLAGNVKEIHNGADDNASGTAMMLELARMLSFEESLQNNYLFIAFSGEERGLLGSSYFTNNPTIGLDSINYMINLDMVGRLNPADNTIAINGFGTSPTWDELLPTIKIDGLKFKSARDGIGPSDHTSFYLKDIPVLHFFTGTHDDYHKPSDDEEKINYRGAFKVYSFIKTLILDLDKKGKLSFSKTKNESTKTAASFKVTLGVIPSYTYDGIGLKLDGVSEGKPAKKAGLEAGDVILKMGDRAIEDIYAYMEVLSNHKKGDKIKVVYKRGDKNEETEVTF